MWFILYELKNYNISYCTSLDWNPNVPYIFVRESAVFGELVMCNVSVLNRLHKEF